MDDKKTVSVRIDVTQETVNAMDDIAAKERWSRRQVAAVALEYYLKLRGYKCENAPDQKT